MADILTLAQARAGLNWDPAKNLDRNAELAEDYIPTVTEHIEAWCGRMEDRTEVWRTDSPSPITTPWPSATIKAVRVGDVALTDWSFAAGVLTITDPSYTSGDQVKITAGGLPVPKSVIEAAKIILAHLWNSSAQGRGTGSGVRSEQEAIPATFVMPRRAEALLNPYRHFGGFA